MGLKKTVSFVMVFLIVPTLVEIQCNWNSFPIVDTITEHTLPSQACLFGSTDTLINSRQRLGYLPEGWGDFGKWKERLFYVKGVGTRLMGMETIKLYMSFLHDLINLIGSTLCLDFSHPWKTNKYSLRFFQYSGAHSFKMDLN